MNTNEPEVKAKQAALALSQKDGLPDDAYVALYRPKSDEFMIYPKVSTLLFKAAKTGAYAGKNKCVFTYDENGILISAQTTIYRLVMDEIRAFEGDAVFLTEYQSSHWHTEKPHMFLSKTALAVALRQAFPDVLSGLITIEEMQCELDFGRKSVLKAEPVLKTEAVSVLLNNNTAAKVEEIFGKFRV